MPWSTATVTSKVHIDHRPSISHTLLHFAPTARDGRLLDVDAAVRRRPCAGSGRPLGLAGRLERLVLEPLLGNPAVRRATRRPTSAGAETSGKYGKLPAPSGVRGVNMDDIIA